jgi:hypothetical protein
LAGAWFALALSVRPLTDIFDFALPTRFGTQVFHPVGFKEPPRSRGILLVARSHATKAAPSS